MSLTFIIFILLYVIKVAFMDIIFLNDIIEFFFCYQKNLIFIHYYYSMKIFSFILFYFFFAHIILRNINDRQSIYVHQDFVKIYNFFFSFFDINSIKHWLLLSISILLFEIFLICQFVFLRFYKELLILIYW